MNNPAINLLKQRTRKVNVGNRVDNPKSIVYLMSRDQRMTFNHALIASQKHAEKVGFPLIVAMALYPSSDNRPAEALDFMLDGLEELKKELGKNKIPIVYKVGGKLEVMRQLEKELAPAAIYIDFSPLRDAQKLRGSLKEHIRCPVFEVDTHNIVPVWQASDKLEYAARTIRPKIHKKLEDFMVYPEILATQVNETKWLEATSFSSDIKAIRSDLNYKKADIVHGFKSGEQAAKKALDNFIEHKLKGYHENRNDPTKDALSNLSPYLHFGQISSLEIALKILEASSYKPELRNDADALIEELVVRKELSDNWCYYNLDYDQLKGAPSWAQKTLAKHADDPRGHIYSFKDFRDAKTHDPAWNASQIQLRKTGKMHGYMRMYWAKKVLEWTAEPKQAIEYLIKLNDFYSLDGGDPNGYAGIMWSVAGVHDRPWQERRVYGTVRSMVYSGLKRKFDIEAYIETYNEL
jgi:deoxyribodipyrimidine photo-lyase